jgi:hypothetical protein
MITPQPMLEKKKKKKKGIKCKWKKQRAQLVGNWHAMKHKPKKSHELSYCSQLLIIIPLKSQSRHE